MRKWILAATATALLAISGGVAFASWGGGSGDEAVQVVGTVRQVDTKYYIDGDLTPLCAPEIVCKVVAVDDGTWLLDFGAANYYLSNPGACDLSTFPDSTNTIEGKLSQPDEIDVYRVDGCDLRSGAEGGTPPWAPGDHSDNDGFEDTVEAHVGTDPLDPCGNDGWPADLDGSNILDIGDVGTFVFPRRGDGSYNKLLHPVPDPEDPSIERWDIEWNATIDIGDMGALLFGAAASPPMFGGQPAFVTDADGPGPLVTGECPWPP